MIKNLFEKLIDWIKEICTINSRLKKLEENALKQYCPNCRKDTLAYRTERCYEIDYHVRFEHIEKIVAHCPCGYSQTISSQKVITDQAVTEHPQKSASTHKIRRIR